MNRRRVPQSIVRGGTAIRLHGKEARKWRVTTIETTNVPIAEKIAVMDADVVGVRPTITTEIADHEKHARANVASVEARRQKVVAMAATGAGEADMIMVAPAAELTPSLLEKIRTVATQKPVIRISEDKTQYEESLKDLLPHARVVELKVDPQARQICLSGQDPDASAAVKRIFENTGYDIKT